MLTSHPRLYGGVRYSDRPAPENVRRLDLNALPLINLMHRHGVYLDKGILSDLGRDVGGRMAEVESEIQDLVHRPLNPESSPQVASLVFHDLGLMPAGGVKFTKTGQESTVDDILSTMKSQHPVVGLILEHRGLDKLQTTYINPLPKLTREYGRIHTTFNATRAATGRLASSNPNLQNQPSRGVGARVRDAFTSTPPDVLHKMGYPGLRTRLVAADLSQIEMVWAAELSQDPIMKDIFIQGLDIHTRTALAMFQLPESAACCQGKDPAHGGDDCPAWNEFKIQYRLPAKTLGFGILYGVTGLGLVLQIAAAGGPEWQTEAADQFISRWFEVYEGVRALMSLFHSRAMRYGLSWDRFGRVRHIPEALSALGNVRSEGLRQAGNMPIQSSAGGTLKLAMAEVFGELLPDFLSRPNSICWPLLQIHDELIFEVTEDHCEEFSSRLCDIMCHATPLSIPVRAGAKIGACWSQLK